MNFKDWSAVIGTWVSICGAVIGGVLALEAYNRDIEVRREEVAKRSDARVVQTFELLKQFQSAEMMRIRNKVTNSSPLYVSRQMRGDQDTFAFVDFFDAVQVCVERSLCDAGLTRQLFVPYARGYLVDELRGFIAEVRSVEASNSVGERPFGYGMEQLSGKRIVDPVEPPPPQAFEATRGITQRSVRPPPEAIPPPPQ